MSNFACHTKNAKEKVELVKFLHESCALRFSFGHRSETEYNGLYNQLLNLFNTEEDISFPIIMYCDGYLYKDMAPSYTCIHKDIPMYPFEYILNNIEELIKIKKTNAYLLIKQQQKGEI